MFLQLECSGHGTCECGMCKCYDGYSGHTCGIANERYEDRDFRGGVDDRPTENVDPTIMSTGSFDQISTDRDRYYENGGISTQFGSTDEHYEQTPTKPTEEAIGKQNKNLNSYNNKRSLNSLY